MLPEQWCREANFLRRESLFRALFLESKDAALSLIIPTRLTLVLPCLPPAPHLLQAGPRKHTSSRGARARKGHIIPHKQDNARQSRLPPAPTCKEHSTALPGHQAQTRNVLPAAPSSLANLGDPSSLGLRDLPSWGRKETEERVCYMAVARCNITQ